MTSGDLDELQMEINMLTVPQSKKKIPPALRADVAFLPFFADFVQNPPKKPILAAFLRGSKLLVFMLGIRKK